LRRGFGCQPGLGCVRRRIGGKPDSAMGGGKDVNKIDDALAMVDDFVASKLS